MLTVSLALHVSVVGGTALSYFHGAATPPASSDVTTPAVMILRSHEMPNLSSQQPASAKSAARTIATTSPAARSSPAQPTTEKALTAATQVLETNPNAHIRALPPEAILSPNPAPHLNGADGVVFILDISGSMYEPYAGSTRLAFARETLSHHIGALKDGTPFAITLYAQRAYNSGPLVAANDATREAAVRFIMRDVDCGGGTNLPAGLAAAEQLHAGAFVLVSDGDLNISATNLAIQADAILGPKGHCPGLAIVGIAPRANATDERLLQSLADQQGGTYLTEQFEGQTSLLTSASSEIKPASVTPKLPW
jgi:Mg-chelatase subunit ChlD